MVITRFAPSPTGDLHVGSARTALYSWLLAKHNQGKYLLRIEDTDQERSTQAAVDIILEGMQWLGLDWDGEVIYQSHRFARYAQVCQQLVDQGCAYQCYCTKARLEALREKQLAEKQKPRYDGHCRLLDLNNPDNQDIIDKPYVIRFKNPQTGMVLIQDMVKGIIRIHNEELDDLIIVRTDGSPTYNFCVVVDDWDMGVTHVIRGDDHINNTPRQLNILEALEAPPPFYGHLPMLLGIDGKRLSKRHGSVSVLQYREEGFLPEALLNYLLRLGWSHGDQEIFSLDEMIKLFDVQKIQHSPAAFNHKKLLWLNQHYLKTSDPEVVGAALRYHLLKQGINEAELAAGPPLAAMVGAQAERCKTLVEMAEKSRCFYLSRIEYDATAVAKAFTPEKMGYLTVLRAALAGVASQDWTQLNLHNVIEQVRASLSCELGDLASPLRVAMTGGSASPSIDITLYLMGQSRTLDRMIEALNWYQGLNA